MRSALGLIWLFAAPVAAAFGYPGWTASAPWAVAKWSMPDDGPMNAFSTEGLGRGLAYAIDEDLCDELLPHFRESSRGYWSVTCDMLHQVIHRSFATWAAHADSISFHEETSLCIAQGGLSSVNGTQELCEVAEIYVRAAPVNGSASGKQPMVDTEVHVSPDDPYTITKVVITLRTESDVFWYWDTSVCDGFLSQRYNALAFMGFGFGLFMCIGICTYFAVLNEQIKALKNPQTGGPLSLCGWVHFVLTGFMHPLKWIFILLITVITGVCYFTLEQCIYDYPIEPALLHGVGAGLGLGNVSDPAVTLLRANTSAVFCDPNEIPLRLVTPYGEDEGLVPCPTRQFWECDDRDASVMLKVDSMHTLTTPTLDDVTALSVLYPLPCEASRVLDGLDPYSAPSSTKYAVWVLLATFAVPLFILVILLPPCGMFAKWLRAGLTPVPDPNAGRKRQKKADFFKPGGQTPVGMAAPDVESATA